MPLIDGTYEILRRQELSETQTLVQATDPDGRPVRIVLYDVAPEHEASFERHRRVLRRLGREDDVLLRDVVSRPGAHYSVWDDPADAPAVDDAPAWHDRLRERGLDPEDALLRRDGRRVVLGLLRWNEARPGSPGRASLASTVVPREGTGDGGRAGPEAPPAAADAAPPAGRRFGDALGRLAALGPRARTRLVASLFALAALALFLIGWERADNDVLVAVPAVAERPAQAAADQLAGLGLVVVPRPTADPAAAGTAVGTVPPAGTELRPGREVQLLYALPPTDMATQDVPNLVGRTLGAELEARLREADLRLGSVARVPADLPAGTVLAQRPAAGGRAGRGEAVALLASDGPRPERTRLPDLVGLDEEDARALARTAGLPAERILVDVVETADASAGEVVGMIPAPWRAIRVDDATLRLLVASGASGAGAAEADAGTPDLVGLASTEAIAAARAAGLAPSVEGMVDPRLPEGVVLQEPQPGAPSTGAVRLTVNARPARLPVPSPTAIVLAPRPREVPYRFFIEPGIPEQTAEVRAITADGTRVTVTTERVSGGDTLEGDWATTTPGPVRFEVWLNDVFYAATRVTP